MENQKPTNPKDAIGVMKASMHVVPTGPLYEMALAMLDGVKYGFHNYRVMGVRASVYVSAAKRHLDAFWEGEDFDPKSKARHLGHVMACCAITLEAQLLDMLDDDRPPRYPDGWLEDFNARWKERAERGDALPPYTEIQQEMLRKEQKFTWESTNTVSWPSTTKTDDPTPRSTTSATTVGRS